MKSALLKELRTELEATLEGRPFSLWEPKKGGLKLCKRKLTITQEGQEAGSLLSQVVDKSGQAKDASRMLPNWQSLPPLP